MAGIEPGIPVSLRQQEATLTQPGLPDLNSHHPLETEGRGPCRSRPGKDSSDSLASQPRSLGSTLPNILLGITLCILANFSFCATKCKITMSIIIAFFYEEEGEEERKSGMMMCEALV